MEATKLAARSVRILRCISNVKTAIVSVRTGFVTRTMTVEMDQTNCFVVFRFWLAGADRMGFVVLMRDVLVVIKYAMVEMTVAITLTSRDV
jgi:hypothetical protein